MQIIKHNTLTTKEPHVKPVFLTTDFLRILANALARGVSSPPPPPLICFIKTVGTQSSATGDKYSSSIHKYEKNNYVPLFPLWKCFFLLQN